MKHFGKCLCVIDTSSIINLDSVRIARKEILESVRRHFHVKVGPRIHAEFVRHMDKLVGGEARYWRRFLNSTARREPQVLTDDANVLSRFYESPPVAWNENNAGERENARLAVELMVEGQAGHIVFVTDDRRSRRSFIDGLCCSFPGVHCWSSLDIVMYVGVYLLKLKKTTMDDIIGALRDVLANIGGDTDTLVKRRQAAKMKAKRVEAVMKYWG